jgi:hypothetical protein
MKLMAIITDTSEVRAILRHLIKIGRAPPALDPPGVRGCPSILRGGYPEALANPATSSLWFSEGDVRSVSAEHDLAAFRRFLALIASRHDGILNKSDIAAPLGMSVPGVGR